ncbi:glycine cleavage system protein R [Smaragdicoccus niigatensis]|uniref:glycine cleavage system protein R n=1 Tax=Smaragdicoccus niigatensis TaxID=359359 RepID=UPI00035F5FAB|nr:ACT domain-containing protein [Smaragdicoccus niigatensis]
MPQLVLTVIGDDRAGLVAALADVVSGLGGNWERSEMAQLAGKFAGIVVVTVPAENVDAMVAATETLDGLLKVTAYPAAPTEGASDSKVLTIDILGSDRPGIVHEIASVLSSRGSSIESMTTATREAPMGGGMLFEAQVVVRVPTSDNFADVRTDLERVAAELMVDLAIEDGN